MLLVSHLAPLSGNKKLMSAPLVIAHRGASAYRPENTLEAFELGIQQGADGIEFDLVTTKDQELVIRHENTLRETTNVQRVDSFTNKRRNGELHNSPTLDWFSEDFTLSELKQLRAVERLPEQRPSSAVFDNQFEIPTFREILGANFLAKKLLVVELKSGSHLNHLTKTIGELAAEEIKASSADFEYFIESFDLEVLLDARKYLSDTSANYLLALEETSVEDVDLQYLSQNFQGLTISLEMLFAEDWVSRCHEIGLQVWAYTARAEEATTSIDEYYERIIETGADAIFADHPDLLRRVLSDRG
ncbi:MAG: Glycerophosphoryl diester phosphodiesterase precursor [Actinomycetota bacterium]